MTIVVIGALRVKELHVLRLFYLPLIWMDIPLGRTTTFEVGLEEREVLLTGGGDITGGIVVTERKIKSQQLQEPSKSIYPHPLPHTFFDPIT